MLFRSAASCATPVADGLVVHTESEAVVDARRTVLDLLLSDHQARSNLHYLYGLLPLPLMLITEMMRVGAAQKVVGDTDYEKLDEEDARALALQIFIAETRVMALGCLIIAALAFRAAGTSGHHF